MIWDRGSLHTRQFQRRSLELPARLEVHPDHAQQIRFSFPEQQCRVSVIDVSEGGLGLRTSVFLPRSARLLIHVRVDGDASGREVVVRAVVRRCIMIDVSPNYQIGLQYLDNDHTDIRELLNRAQTETSQTNGEVAHDG
ncbi:MAG: PilZ domain-containing protein [Phycisphaerae bacterium]